MKSPVIIDLFKSITEKLKTDLNKPTLNFQHGHHREITSILTEMSKNPTNSAKKYPLIALFQDFEEVRKGDFINVKLQMIVATLTKNTLTAPERYTQSFRPELYPIYDALLDAIARSTYFDEATVKQIEHTKIDRLFWGRNGLYGSESNIFNDYIDCIEIKDLKLKVKLKNC